MLRWIATAAVAVTMHGAALAEAWQKVVDPAALNALLSKDVVVLDVRAPKDYAKAHVPGALNAPYGYWRGPRQNPGRPLDDERLTRLLQFLGIDHGDRVVVTYAGRDASDFGAAARVYWTLKSAGLTEIAILNGGVAAWGKAGLPLSNKPSRAVPSTATFVQSRDWMIDRAGVQAVLDGRRDALMVDARPADFWRGKVRHPAAKQAGTLKGALNITHSSWFTGSKTEIVSAEQVLAIAKAAGYVPGRTELVSFCNTGHWASTNWFALSELAGIEGVKLYPESMVGWTGAGGAATRGGS